MHQCIDGASASNEMQRYYMYMNASLLFPCSIGVLEGQFLLIRGEEEVALPLEEVPSPCHVVGPHIVDTRASLGICGDWGTRAGVSHTSAFRQRRQ